MLSRAYERTLVKAVRRGSLPHHIGLILDGNGRARPGGRPVVLEGQGPVTSKLEEVLRWCEELDVRMVTVWIGSTENLMRQPEEAGELLHLLQDKLRDAARDPGKGRRRMRIRVIGTPDSLPPSMRAAVREAGEATRTSEDFLLTVALGYGGRQEIADAVRSLLRDRAGQGLSLERAIQEVTPENLEKYLYTFDLPDPDLIIRTSGEVRSGGFLLWQSAYSELYFSDASWPEFRRLDLLRAIRDFQKRERRFGS
jgi:short-chain Z-isoprenyl diphosphate synthase